MYHDVYIYLHVYIYMCEYIYTHPIQRPEVTRCRPFTWTVLLPSSVPPAYSGFKVISQLLSPITPGWSPDCVCGPGRRVRMRWFVLWNQFSGITGQGIPREPYIKSDSSIVWNSWFLLYFSIVCLFCGFIPQPPTVTSHVHSQENTAPTLNVESYPKPMASIPRTAGA